MDGFVFKFYPRLWPRNSIGFVCAEHIAEMLGYYVHRSTNDVTKGTKSWWSHYFYQELHNTATPLYDVETPLYDCNSII